ncbi:MAG TPA: PTS sugar transporter subunit IIB [Longimicrobiaceae bacterium]|nr:PTS sugar transporter subunit IIB [Longimicrobiaceae bacterium]
MSIVLFRVDERLIHGQVVVGWVERLHVDRIIVVDDEIAASEWEKELYCLGVPPEADAMFVTVATARQDFASWMEQSRRLVVLVRSVETLSRLAEGGLLNGQTVNLGGIHHAPGRERFLPYLFLSDDELKELERLVAAGVTIAARDLPGSRSVPLGSLRP